VVHEEKVEVVVPRRMSLRRVPPFVEEKRRWIERTLDRQREARALVGTSRLADGGSVRYLGEDLELDVWVEPGRVRPHVKRRGDLLTVKVPDARRSTLRTALEAWYRRQARDEVAARLDAAVARRGTSYTRLSIRSQRSRWASCSDLGAMSFNWRLLLAPAEILDYVVEHEVAHLDVLDHSRRFWALLDQRRPGWRDEERWLRAHGSALHL